MINTFFNFLLFFCSRILSQDKHNASLNRSNTTICTIDSLFFSLSNFWTSTIALWFWNFRIYDISKWVEEESCLKSLANIDSPAILIAHHSDATRSTQTLWSSESDGYLIDYSLFILNNAILFGSSHILENFETVYWIECLLDTDYSLCLKTTVLVLIRLMHKSCSTRTALVKMLG